MDCHARHIRVVSEVIDDECIEPEDTCRFTLERHYYKRNGYVPTPIPWLPCSFLTKDYLLAAQPEPPRHRAVYDSVASGIFIAQQRNNKVDGCVVNDVKSWGVAAGIIIGDGLVDEDVHRHPGVSTGHILTNNIVKQITSYHPGSFCTPQPPQFGKRDVESTDIVQRNGEPQRVFIPNSDRNVSTIVLDRFCANLCETDLIELLSFEDLSTFTAPRVYGIADIRLCEHNHFIPWFAINQTEKCLDEIVPWFISDTVVFGNKVINALNWWTKFCNAFEFFYLNPHALHYSEGSLLDENVCDQLRPPDHPSRQDIFRIRGNTLDVKNFLQGPKNKGLYWSRDLGVHTFEKDLLGRACDDHDLHGHPYSSEGSGSNSNGPPPPAEEDDDDFCCDDCPLFQPAIIGKINWHICSSFQRAYVDGELQEYGPSLLDALTFPQQTAWCQQQIAMLLLTTECSETDIRYGQLFCQLAL